MAVGSSESLSRLEVATPQWVERVGVRLHLHVAPDGDIGGANQPSDTAGSAHSFRVEQSSKQLQVARLCPARNADPEKQCGAAFGWTTGSTFISRRTLGSVRLLLSTPLVQLRAAVKPPCSLPRPLRASGVDSASLRPIRQS